MFISVTTAIHIKTSSRIEIQTNIIFKNISCYFSNLANCVRDESR